MAASIPIEVLRERLFTAVVCDALDAVGRREQSPAVPLRPLTTDGVLVGRARTTLWAEVETPSLSPYEIELRAVDSCAPDSVFIAAAAGAMSAGIWGELLSTAALRRGVAGAVIDGAVRDVRAMRAMRFPVFARGTSPYDSANRLHAVDLDAPVELGGVRIVPGDLVVADADGLVVVPAEVETEVIDRAWRKVTGENAVREAIRRGMSAAEAWERFGIL